MPPPTDANDPREIDYKGEAAKRLAHRCIDANASDRSLENRHKQDWLNLLINRGGEDNMWVAWDQVGDAWVRIPSDGDYGLPPEVPRGCTNVFANKIDGIASILNQSEPAQEWRPTSDDDEDLATAEVAGDITPVLWEEIGYNDLKPVLNKAACLTDKVLLLVSYDPDPKYGESMVQAYRCLGCGKLSMPMDIEEAGDCCPDCGCPADYEDEMSGETSENFEPAVDSQFNPIGVNYPVGKLCGEMLMSFEYSLPPNSASPHLDENRWVHVHKRYTEDEFVETWGDDFRDLAKNHGGTKDGKGQSQQYADAMRTLTSPHAIGSAGRIEGPLVHRIYHDPVESDEFYFPEGLYIALCGDTVLDAGPLPVHDDRGTPIKPGVIRTFRQEPGTAAGKPPADDLVPLQRMRNLWETIGMLIGLRYAMPTTFVPTTVTLETPITGLPQPEVRFRSHDGQKPVTESGRADGRFVWEQIDRIDASMDSLSNLNAILQGERPAGDPTLGEVMRLEDRGYGQFKTPLDGLIRFEKDLSLMLLRFARETFWAPRMLRVRGENDRWEVHQFTNADLSGHVDIYVNPISAWPKSQLTQQLRLAKAVELGIVIPAQDPELQVKVLSDWNLSHLKKSLDVDRKQVARELDKWKQATGPQDIPPPQPPPVINPVIHMHYKSAFLKTEEAEKIRDANPPVWQAMLMHVQMLQMMVAPPMPAPAPGGKGGDAPRPDGSAVDAAVQSGAIAPAGAQGAGVQDLVSQGVILPADAAAAHAQATGPSIDDLLENEVLMPVTPGQTDTVDAPPM